MSNISVQWADGMELRVKEQAAQIAALTAERDALKADAAALDWIEYRAMNGQIQIARSIMGTGYEVAVIERGAPTTVKVYSGTLRKAIDAASKGQTPGNF